MEIMVGTPPARPGEPPALPFRTTPLNKALAAVVLLAASTLALADTSPAKKELVNRVLELQRPAIEAQVRAMAERPAVLIMQSVNAAVQQRVPLEKREPLIKEIQAEVRKFVEESGPLLRSHALRLLPQTSGAVLEAKFSEAELKQLLAALEAPAFRKYQQASEEMLRPLSERLATEARGDMEPRLKALEQNIRNRMNNAIGQEPPPAKP